MLALKVWIVLYPLSALLLAPHDRPRPPVLPSAAYQYFIHIVPTTYVPPGFKLWLNTNQYSVTHFTRTIAARPESSSSSTSNRFTSRFTSVRVS